MTPLSPRSPRLFSTALSFAVLCALALLSASAAAFPIADAVYLRLNDTLAIHPVELYAGCDLAPEYAARAALLCRGIVFQTFLLLAAHYVSFEKPLLIFLFVLRGLSFGLAFRLCLHLHAASAPFYLLGGHAVVSMIFLFLLYSLYVFVLAM